jgi:hypothetical protein
MNSRDELIEALKQCLVYVPGNGSRYADDLLVDFIINDRKRIVLPLLEAKGLPAKCRAIDETLKLAGYESTEMRKG